MTDLGVSLVFYGLLVVLGAAGALMIGYAHDEIRRQDRRRLK